MATVHEWMHVYTEPVLMTMQPIAACTGGRVGG